MTEEKTEKKTEKPSAKVAISKIQLPQLSVPAAIIVAGLIIGLAIVYSNTGFKSSTTPPPTGSGPTTPPGGTPPTNPPPSGTPVDVSEDDDPFIGNADAPVVIIEFSDFQCPFCRRFFTDTLSQIEDKYIKTGKAKLVYRDIPLSFHPAAQKAAESAECADDQGKWRQMHDKIFTEQGKQGEGTIQFTVDDMKKWAGEIGLNAGQFSSCLDSGKYTDEVAKDSADAAAAGVTGTPTFFINGKRIIGAQPYSVFEQMIEAELK